ncbi:MAG: hypothetical protein AAB521_04985 [Patescibacteria group bacterium]
MSSSASNLLEYLKSKISHPYSFFISIFFLVISWLASSIHYTQIAYGNNLSWIAWAISIFTFLYSISSSNLSIKKLLSSVGKREFLIVIFIIAMYLVVHLWNFSSAPWNQNGLFDDAAWDIYFAKNHAFNGPFQAAFFDDVGYISREVVFHYYISIFFKIFGYNLLVFNISLLFLGLITVFFTTFLIHKIFKNTIITIISTFILNFFPLHFMHIFMGHRYAIAAPLMMISFYFLYQAFMAKSFFRAAVSALFAGLCWDSAIMGKQYILGLILSAFLILIFGKRKWRSKENIATGIIWIFGFFIASTPLLVYILFNYDDYVIREKGLLSDFMSLFVNGGFTAVKPYFDQLSELFFAEHSFRRQFLPDFYIIPLVYYLLLIPGIFITFIKRRFELLILSFLPILGALLSGSYDFRVLLAVPIWAICIAYFLDFVFKSEKLSNKNLSYLLIVTSLIVILFGLISSMSYLWNVSKNPNYLYLLPHKDVAVSRLIQDIVIGSKNPTSKLKHNEFNKTVNLSNVSHDTLVCPFSAYAIIHLYLQNYDDKKILAFCNQSIQLLKDEREILNDNVNAIRLYNPNTKDLKLVWEISDKTGSIIDYFSKFGKYGSEESIVDISDDTQFSLYVLTIKSNNVALFRNEILNQYAIEHHE